jgi:hypothetical protein
MSTRPIPLSPILPHATMPWEIAQSFPEFECYMRWRRDDNEFWLVGNQVALMTLAKVGEEYSRAPKKMPKGRDYQQTIMYVSEKQHPRMNANGKIEYIWRSVMDPEKLLDATQCAVTIVEASRSVLEKKSPAMALEEIVGHAKLITEQVADDELVLHQNDLVIQDGRLEIHSLRLKDGDIKDIARAPYSVTHIVTAGRVDEAIAQIQLEEYRTAVHSRNGLISPGLLQAAASQDIEQLLPQAAMPSEIAQSFPGFKCYAQWKRGNGEFWLIGNQVALMTLAKVGEDYSRAPKMTPKGRSYQQTVMYVSEKQHPRMNANGKIEYVWRSIMDREKLLDAAHGAVTIVEMVRSASGKDSVSRALGTIAGHAMLITEQIVDDELVWNLYHLFEQGGRIMIRSSPLEEGSANKDIARAPHGATHIVTAEKVDQMVARIQLEKKRTSFDSEKPYMPILSCNGRPGVFVFRPSRDDEYNCLIWAEERAYLAGIPPERGHCLFPDAPADRISHGEYSPS